MPSEILAAIGRRRWDRGIEVLLSTPQIPDSVVQNPQIGLGTWHVLGATRALVASGRVRLLSWRYSELSRFLIRPWDRPKVLLAQVRHDPRMGLSAGVTGSVTLDMVQGCDMVIAEINDAQPSIASFDTTAIGVDWAIDVAPAPPIIASRKPTSVELAIGESVASLIPNGATVQLGLGGVLDAVPRALAGHRELGVHSGMISDGIHALTEQGVITNSHKGWMNGKTVTGLVIGSESLVRWTDGNPGVVLAPISETHNPRTLANLQVFVAVNSAVEVDLHGQAGAEYLAGEPFAGIGGQPDFAFAAASNISPGSASILALPSTSSDGTHSRIVPGISPPGVVTTPRYCVDFVVTEWGIAALRGLAADDRNRALIAIAHPGHRSALERAAFETKRLGWPHPGM